MLTKIIFQSKKKGLYIFVVISQGYKNSKCIVILNFFVVLENVLLNITLKVISIIEDYLTSLK